MKLKKKKEAMTLRLQKEQQEVTAKLVEKHSKQMLDLLKEEQEKLKQELEEELVGIPFHMNALTLHLGNLFKCSCGNEHGELYKLSLYLNGSSC